VEIGFGGGEFLVKVARAHPEKDFVGLEIEWPSVRRALKKVSRAGIENVRVAQADARVAMERLFAPRSICRVYSLFPFPWPKRRHLKHRLFSRGFLKLVNSRLIHGGEALIVTDHREYANWTMEEAQGTGLDPLLTVGPPRFSTKYERKWCEQGQLQFFEVTLKKREHVEVPVKEDVPVMSYRVDHFDPDSFEPADERGETTVQFKEYIYDGRRRKAMVRVFVGEGSLDQEFWIEIVKKDRYWQIRCAQGCQIVPTVGVQRALALVHGAVAEKGSSNPRSL
jgi:tRNA (guanine-N7-)-methyltransferase